MSPSSSCCAGGSRFSWPDRTRLSSCAVIVNVAQKLQVRAGEDFPDERVAGAPSLVEVRPCIKRRIDGPAQLLLYGTDACEQLFQTDIVRDDEQVNVARCRIFSTRHGAIHEREVDPSRERPQGCAEWIRERDRLEDDRP
jgi:hypothetical protein